MYSSKLVFEFLIITKMNVYVYGFVEKVSFNANETFKLFNFFGKKGEQSSDYTVHSVTLTKVSVIVFRAKNASMNS